MDLLFASSGIEPEIARTAEQLEISLIALKLLARDDETRPQDLADLNELLKNATSEDIEEAREATRLITKRGFNRDRDLLASLEQLLLRREA